VLAEDTVLYITHQNCVPTD